MMGYADMLRPEDQVALARNQVLYSLGQQSDEFLVEKLREGYMECERELETVKSPSRRKELERKMWALRDEITSDVNSKGSQYKFVKMDYSFYLTIMVLRFGTHFRLQPWFAVKRMAATFCGVHGEVSSMNYCMKSGADRVTADAFDIDHGRV